MPAAETSSPTGIPATEPTRGPVPRPPMIELATRYVMSEGKPLTARVLLKLVNISSWYRQNMNLRGYPKGDAHRSNRTYIQW